MVLGLVWCLWLNVINFAGRTVATPSFSLHKKETLKSWEWQGDEASCLYIAFKYRQMIFNLKWQGLSSAQLQTVGGLPSSVLWILPSSNVLGSPSFYVFTICTILYCPLTTPQPLPSYCPPLPLGIPMAILSLRPKLLWELVLPTWFL